MNRKIKVYLKDGRIVVFCKVACAGYEESGTLLRVYGASEGTVTAVGEFSRESVLGFSSSVTNEVDEITTLENVIIRYSRTEAEPK